MSRFAKSALTNSNRRAGPNKSTDFQTSDWKKSAQDRSAPIHAAPSTVSPIVEEDGGEFTEVSRRSRISQKTNPYGNNDPRSHDPLKNIANGRQNTRLDGAKSSASSFRDQPYSSARKTSGYKQSCLPKDQRDPVLLLVENNRGMKMDKADFKPGMIIRAPLHEQDSSLRDDLGIPDDHVSETKFGRIFTKYRKMIVLAMYQDHYLAVPLYSHNGKGLENKERPDEYISVRDHRMRGNFVNLAPHEALVTEHLNPGIEVYHKKTTAHFTYALPRSYHLPVVMEGRLTPPSLKNLVQMFQKYTLQAISFEKRL